MCFYANAFDAVLSVPLEVHEPYTPIQSNHGKHKNSISLHFFTPFFLIFFILPSFFSLVKTRMQVFIQYDETWMIYEMDQVTFQLIARIVHSFVFVCPIVVIGLPIATSSNAPAKQIVGTVMYS